MAPKKGGKPAARAVVQVFDHRCNENKHSILGETIRHGCCDFRVQHEGSTTKEWRRYDTTFANNVYYYQENAKRSDAERRGVPYREPEFEPEAIRDHKCKKKHPLDKDCKSCKVLVKWQDWDEGCNTWETLVKCNEKGGLNEAIELFNKERLEKERPPLKLVMSRHSLLGQDDIATSSETPTPTTPAPTTPTIEGNDKDEHLSSSEMSGGGRTPGYEDDGEEQEDGQAKSSTKKSSYDMPTPPRHDDERSDAEIGEPAGKLSSHSRAHSYHNSPKKTYISEPSSSSSTSSSSTVTADESSTAASSRSRPHKSKTSQHVKERVASSPKKKPSQPSETPTKRAQTPVPQSAEVYQSSSIVATPPSSSSASPLPQAAAASTSLSAESERSPDQQKDSLKIRIKKSILERTSTDVSNSEELPAGTEKRGATEAGQGEPVAKQPKLVADRQRTLADALGEVSTSPSGPPSSTTTPQPQAGPPYRVVLSAPEPEFVYFVRDEKLHKYSVDTPEAMAAHKVRMQDPAFREQVEKADKYLKRHAQQLACMTPAQRFAYEVHQKRQAQAQAQGIAYSHANLLHLHQQQQIQQAQQAQQVHQQLPQPTTQVRLPPGMTPVNQARIVNIVPSQVPQPQQQQHPNQQHQSAMGTPPSTSGQPMPNNGVQQRMMPVASSPVPMMQQQMQINGQTVVVQQPMQMQQQHHQSALAGQQQQPGPSSQLQTMLSGPPPQGVQQPQPTQQQYMQMMAHQQQQQRLHAQQAHQQHLQQQEKARAQQAAQQEQSRQQQLRAHQQHQLLQQRLHQQRLQQATGSEPSTSTAVAAPDGSSLTTEQKKMLLRLLHTYSIQKKLPATEVMKIIKSPESVNNYFKQRMPSCPLIANPSAASEYLAAHVQDCATRPELFLESALTLDLIAHYRFRVKPEVQLRLSTHFSHYMVVFDDDMRLLKHCPMPANCY